MTTRAELLASWPRPARPAGQALVVTAGLPGAGKSYFARALAQAAGAALVSVDDLREALSDGQPTFAPEEHAAVFGASGALVAALLDAGHAVIADATNRLARDRKAALLPARQRGIPTLLVWCEADEATAATRLEARAAGMDPADRSRADAAVRARMAERMSRPAAHEADAIVTLTPDTFDAALAAARAWLESVR